ncbi:MAG TPA: hypothetical protein DCO79_11855 [Spirochaeta sp.]|nr:hypothetical protein [Spirochaeta sp.]
MIDFDNYDCFPKLAEALSNRTDKQPPSSCWEDLLGKTGIERSLLFVLVDGMGECYINRLSPDSFLRDSKRKIIKSVFPSTTASAMMSLATTLPVAAHGIPGRYSYLKTDNLHLDSLAFRERFSGKALSLELSPKQLWPLPSFITESEITAFSVIPQVLLNSPFQSYLCGDRNVGGYSSIADGVDLIINQIKYESSRTFNFFYLWDLDSLGHREGMHSSRMDELLILINTELERLYDGLKSIADIVISADHGHIDAGEADIITPDHKLMSFLETPPFGEPRAAQLQVKPEREKDFRAYFNETFGDRFSLRPVKDSAALFGGRRLSKQASRSFANYIAIAETRNLLVYSQEHPAKTRINKAEHGGILPEERLIPLIIPK